MTYDQFKMFNRAVDDARLNIARASDAYALADVQPAGLDEALNAIANLINAVKLLRPELP